MRNFTFLKTGIINLILVMFFMFLSSNVFAEGTPSVSPNSTAITSLLSAPDLLSGPYYGCGEDNRIKFYVTDNVNENLYFGFDFRNYVVGATTRQNNVYWRIFNPSGTVVASGNWNSTIGSAGSIDNYTQAINGPNIGGITTGYAPLTFNPVVNGEFYMEIYRSNDAGVTPDNTAANGRIHAPFFDLTVANNSGTFAKHNGRVYCDRWSFYACDPTNFGNVATANSEPNLYVYTPDQCVMFVDFQSGLQPIAYNASVNSYGVSTASTWDVTRKSVNSAVGPTLLNGYHMFLNSPDVGLFPVGAIPVNPSFLSPAVTGCGPYIIHYNVAEAGDVQLLLDLNGTVGYQSGTSDLIIEALGVSAGNNTISWNGLNGLGAVVPSGTSVNLGLTFLKGRFNLPLFDAEMNKNGIRVSLLLPVPIANARMFWDDSLLTNVGATCDGSTGANNTTGAGINNSFVGSNSPAHAWSGNGNPAQTIPAPQIGINETDGFQCSDFGNVRTINSWGWGYSSASTNLNLVLGCANLGITKTVNNTTPAVGSNVTFTLTASNAGPSLSPNTIVNDLLSASCYTFVSATPSVGSYNSVSGVWSIGTLANGANATLSIVAKVTSQTSCGNTATITGDQEDPTPANNTATATPVPFISPIDAINDNAITFNGATGGTTASSVLINDTLNSAPVSLSTVTLSGVSVPAGLTLNPSGTITVASGTPSGTYLVVYKICETLNPANCDNATATIIVATIDAINDTPTPINGTPGGITTSVLANDTLNGSPLVASDATLTPVTIPSGLT
ncbi:DUF11 domain-containing protein, partial [Flavobacterium sp.]|uniref:DUF11 domain-containing protein n=1 Tax=Flavobacterium sp. TaxID=239 RepID=UPI0037516BA0